MSATARSTSLIDLSVPLARLPKSQSSRTASFGFAQEQSASLHESRIRFFARAVVGLSNDRRFFVVPVLRICVFLLVIIIVGVPRRHHFGPLESSLAPPAQQTAALSRGRPPGPFSSGPPL